MAVTLSLPRLSGSVTVRDPGQDRAYSSGSRSCRSKRIGRIQRRQPMTHVANSSARSGLQPLTRRSLLLGLTGLAVVAGARSAGASTQARTLGPMPRRRIRAQHLHTGESVDVVYFENGRYAPRSLAVLDHFLRDHRDGSIHPIDPVLFDFLHIVNSRLGGRQPVEIVCGYRSEKSNALLRSISTGVAKNSLHMIGQAIDIRIPGRSVAEIAQVAESVQRGGVGRYRRSGFVHLDTGNVRTWGS
jgi:uncharacterized protein YcbK (DUF882 family)